MLSKVMLIGRLGRDPELKTGQSGKSYTTFTVATNDGFGDNRRTDWHNCTAFGQTAELVCKYLKKGSLCAVEGRLQYDSYEKDGIRQKTTKILADHVTFIGSKSDNLDAGQSQDFQKPMSDDTFEGMSFDYAPY